MENKMLRKKKIIHTTHSHAAQLTHGNVGIGFEQRAKLYYRPGGKTVTSVSID